MLASFEPLLRSISSTLMVPIGLGLVAYVWMCATMRQR